MFHDAIVLSVLELFCGESLSGSLTVQSFKAKQLRADLALMIPIGDDTDLFNEDMHTYNTSTGTRFENFFKIAGKGLQRNGNLEVHSFHQPCTTGDKEAGGVTYIPPCVSVRDLHKKDKKQCL